MSDTVKVIIEIPQKVFEARKMGEISPWVTVPILDAVQNGIPLDSVKAEIKEKCDRIDDIARANIFQYAPHREIQDLLCEILASIGWTTEEMMEQIRAEREEKPNE